MTPIESRSSNNVNRVRCFNEAALVPTTAEKKWSLVKVICTQPFNRHVQYGLSFIKVHIAQSQSAKANKIVEKTKNPVHQQRSSDMCSETRNPSSFQIGKFKLREDSPDSETDGASNLFNRWKKSKDDKTEQTTATSIRLASNAALSQATSRSKIQNNKTYQSNENLDVLDRNRDSLLYGDDKREIDEEKEFRLSKIIEADKQRRHLELQKQSEKKRRSIDVKRTNDNNNTANDNLISTQTSVSSSETNPSVPDRPKKRHSSPQAERPPKKEKRSHIRYKPFNELLKGVVLVISGIQNPDRSDLRNKALALGAKYKGDWDSTCTHLMYV